MKKVIYIFLMLIICIANYCLLNFNRFIKIDSFNHNSVYIETKELEEQHEETIVNIIAEEKNEKYNSNLYKINSDMIGWIKIENSNIDYPVMQNGNYYLDRDFYKNKSKNGTPYLASYCDIDNSNNLIIFGHNIKSGIMFNNLNYYKNYNYYLNHKHINLYLKNKNIIYTIFSVIVTTANDNGFNFYGYYNFDDEKSFDEYIEKLKQNELYETGITPKYGEQLITLVTCEYSQNNGRIVVIGTTH